MLKAHVQWRKFYKYKLDLQQGDFGTDTDGLLRQTLILNQLNSLENNLMNDKLFKGLNKGVRQTRQKKLISIKTLNPEEDSKQKQAMKVFNESKFYKEETKKMNKIWKKANKGEKIGKKEFEMCSQFTRFNLHNENKNRAAPYMFKNVDYGTKIPKWFPEGIHTEDSEDFKRLPSGWNPDAPPENNPTQEPTGYVLEVFGDQPGIKNQTATTICFSKRMHDMCEQLRDIKEVVFEDIRGENEFFVNFKGEPLGPIKNSKGSYLYHFTRITGVSRATVTTGRRVATELIQSDPYLNTQEHRIQHHSEKVALQNYDRGGPTLKLQVTNWMLEKEGGSYTKPVIPEEVLSRRATRSSKDKEAAKHQAISFLRQNAKMRKAKKLNRTCRCLPEHVKFFQRLFTSQEANEVYEAIKENKFPGNRFKI